MIMAPATKPDEVDYFAIMGLTPSATDAEIRKAHKKLSLALHPDKNRDMDAVEAAAHFSAMQLAYEVLMDPSARLAAAERAKAEALRKERRGAYDGKRKAMAEELERREGEEREKKFKGGIQDERRRAQTLQRLREEGRRLREDRERRVNDTNASLAQSGVAKAKSVEETGGSIDVDILMTSNNRNLEGKSKSPPKSTSFPRFSFGKPPATKTMNVSAPLVTSNESDILQRMRQAARQRVEEAKE